MFVLHNLGQKKIAWNIFSHYSFFSSKESFLVYLHPAGLMNIQLLTELQANIHGNELINMILLASIWFMKYVEVFMIFHILFSSWILKRNGIFDNNCYPDFYSWVYFFLIFFECISKCFQIIVFLQTVDISFSKNSMNKKYEWLKNSFKIFYILIHTQHLFFLLSIDYNLLCEFCKKKKNDSLWRSSFRDEMCNYLMKIASSKYIWWCQIK